MGKRDRNVRDIALSALSAVKSFNYEEGEDRSGMSDKGKEEIWVFRKVIQKGYHLR